MQSDRRAIADGGQRLRLSKDLCVRANTDLKVLRPEAVFEQGFLDSLGFVGAGN
jgi:hypothetical protein